MKEKNVTRAMKKGFAVLLSTALILAAVIGAGVVKQAEAKAKVNDGTFTGLSKSVYYSDSAYGLFRKITFRGSKVTFQGKFKVKISGKKQTVTKLTLTVASNCKYYEAWDTGLHAVNKSKMRKSIQKGSFIQLDVKVKNGKVVRFVNGA